MRSSTVHVEPLPLRPAHVHPHQHLGPVLRLGAAGAGMDGEDGIAAVVGSLEHRLQLEGPSASSRAAASSAVQLGRQRRIGFGVEQFGQPPTASSMRATQRRDRRDPALERLDSCTCSRARSLSDQKAGSVCRPRVPSSRAALLDVKESLGARPLLDPTSAPQICHRPLPPGRAATRVAVSDRPMDLPKIADRARRHGTAQPKSWRPSARISFSASVKKAVAAGDLLPDLLGVLLPALPDLLGEQLLEIPLRQPPLALLGMIDHQVGDQRAGQSARPGRRGPAAGTDC